MTLTTPWGADLDPESVLQEYPRPQLVRNSYLNLNGSWQYAITSARRDQAPADGDWDGQILVPFSPEAALSGVHRQLQPQQLLWYRRTVRLPAGFVDDRVLLHFGAVDQSCTVTVNGTQVGGHDGGYLPFSLDVTDALVPGAEQEIVVRVRDVSDTEYHSRGKQVLDRGGIWYTAQSGIWQTV
ncbi:beta-galactosidase/beta-glucuronidase [Arthrobacter sp. UYP6]|uniref:sugar-binding domain-containing protein n=1 Tax=Arthrobacter sp. UYP6 TaxID=1756378 RepID=UPI00339980A6